jgi:hypothetical protein
MDKVSRDVLEEEFPAVPSNNIREDIGFVKAMRIG